MNPFDYVPKLENSSVNLKKKKEGYRIFSVRFSSAIDTGYTRNSYVMGDYYLPDSDTPFPFLILVHGMGDYSVIPCRILSRYLVKQGVACFVPYLTIHSKRLPKEMKSSMPYLSPEEWFNVYRISITDIRQIIDWAETRDEIIGNRIFLSGISFGGFVSTIVMGLDDRIKAGVFIVTGGNSNKLSWDNKEGQYRKRYKRTEEEHLKIMADYKEYLNRVEESGFENVHAGHISFLTDPLTFSRYLRDRPVLMINAKKDKYIPVENVTELWTAINKPDIKWYPSGHVTLWLWYSSIRDTIWRFLRLFLKSVQA
ncbi:MAG: alpha/beta hydrolase family protein [Dehalococcoidales bacterium]|nr:alpha/beta hydrolase family protein [Dehalococcoidales bacterium]